MNLTPKDQLRAIELQLRSEANTGDSIQRTDNPKVTDRSPEAHAKKLVEELHLHEWTDEVYAHHLKMKATRHKNEQKPL